jgi:hypothetical protein
VDFLANSIQIGINATMFFQGDIEVAINAFRDAKGNM